MCDRNLRSNVRPCPGFFCGHVEAGRPVHTIAIEQGHCRDLSRRADSRQRLRKRSSFQERKSGAGVEFDILHGQSYIPSTNNCPETRSRNTRYNPDALSLWSINSHSSRFHRPSLFHHWPLPRHGPAEFTTCNLIPPKAIVLGRSPFSSTLAASGGRKNRSASRGEGRHSLT